MHHTRPTVGIRLPIWAGSTTPVLRGVANYMRTHHGHWRIETLNDGYGEMEKLQISVGWQGDGLILYRASERELADFKKRKIAVILLSSEGPDLGFPRVLPDNEEVGKIAAQHLLSLGIKSFAYLARGETLYRQEEYISGSRRYSRERLASFKATLKQAGHEPKVSLLPGFPLWEKDTWKRVEKEVEKFLVDLPAQTGLFAVDDALACVVLRVAERMHIAVPQSLAVIGFGDDVNYCHTSLPSLTSIPYPAQEIGARAAKELAKQMNGDRNPGSVIRMSLNSVCRRESTDFLAIEDEETERLVRWIRQEAPHKAIRVEDLLQQTNYSHSAIKMRFSAHLGHSPKKEIARARISHLKHLLNDPSLSIVEIAELMEFNSPHELGRFFQRETGERPTTYRESKRKPLVSLPESDQPYSSNA